MATVQAEKDQLVRDFNAVIEDAENLLKAATSGSNEKIASIRAGAEEHIRNARDRMSQMQRSTVERARGAVQATHQYVHENPWRTAGSAFATGLAVGLVLGLVIGRAE